MNTNTASLQSRSASPTAILDDDVRVAVSNTASASPSYTGIDAQGDVAAEVGAPALVGTEPKPIKRSAFLESFRSLPERRWFTPLITIAATVASYFALYFVLGYPMTWGWFGQSVADAANSTANLNQNAIWVLIRYGFIAIMLPVIGLIVARVDHVRLRDLASVTGKIRIPLLWRGFAVALGFTVPFLALQFAVMPIPAETVKAALPAILVALVIVPLQCAAEEFLFRGYLLKAFGGWGLRTVPAALLSTVLFTASHAYGLAGLSFVFVLGAVFSFIAIRTGGIEGSFAFHTVNNLSIAITGALMIVDGLSDAHVTLPVFIVYTVRCVVMALVMTWWLRRTAIRNGDQLVVTR